VFGLYRAAEVAVYIAAFPAMVVQRCDAPRKHLPDVNYLGFNQDQTCLAIGTWCGFMIFSTENLELLLQEACGSISLIEMLFRTSLLALMWLSSPHTPMSSSRKLTMWNTKEQCSVCQLHVSAHIHGVKMNHRRLAVLLKLKIHIFDLKTLKSLHVLDRSASAWADPALDWLCASSERGHLATPVSLAENVQRHGTDDRNVCLPLHSEVLRDAHLQNNAWSHEADFAPAGDQHASPCDHAEAKFGLVTLVDTYTLKPVGTVLAHRSPVQALCLNPTGQLLATASTKGTVIRIFGVPSLDLLCAFRRGASSCRIFGLLFSRDSTHVCASASSGTVHIFKNSNRMLDSLPLHSEDATVGAAQREMVARTMPLTGHANKMDNIDIASLPIIACGEQQQQQQQQSSLTLQQPEKVSTSAVPITTAVRLGPVNSGPREEITDDADELSEWNVVAERPERLLELCINVPSYDSACTRRNPLHTLSAVSGYAVQNTAKYAKSFLQMLPQPCRELVDAPRAFAWVHLKEQEELPSCDHTCNGRPGDLGYLIPKLPFADNLRCAMLGGASDGQSVHGGFVACVIARLQNGGNRSEVLVATARGCAHIYDWSPTDGGECRLRREFSLIGEWSQHFAMGPPEWVQFPDMSRDE